MEGQEFNPGDIVIDRNTGMTYQIVTLSNDKKTVFAHISWIHKSKLVAIRAADLTPYTPEKGGLYEQDKDRVG